MRFLVDECAGPGVALWLKNQGHDVFSVYENLKGATDAVVMRTAFEDRRILITSDKGFGEKIYKDRASHHGVVLLRLVDERTSLKIEVLKMLLDSHISQLSGSFVVVSESDVRFAS